ncbi:MAG: hypothetical protein V4611_03015 [Patescibacteria group bacterium]
MALEAQMSHPTVLFDVTFTQFLLHRRGVQKKYLTTQLGFIEEQYRLSGSARPLAGWLTEEVKDVLIEANEGMWDLLFATLKGGDGRLMFVQAFNRLLRTRRIRVRLHDNGERMRFFRT